MHCNLRPPETRQPFSALITTPCQVWRRWTYPLPYYSVFAADTLLYAVTLTFDLWPLTLNICSVSPMMWWNCARLCQIWTQSSNPRRSYCHFNIWLYDLEHVLRVALGSGGIFTTFDLRQLIRAWIIAFFKNTDTLCHAVTLTFDPLTFKDYGTSSVVIKAVSYTHLTLPTILRV